MPELPDPLVASTTSKIRLTPAAIAGKRPTYVSRDARAHVIVQERPVVLARDDLDHRIAAELFERQLEEADGAFQVEGVLLTDVDVQLAGELRPQTFPIPRQPPADVILLPGASDDRIDAISNPNPVPRI